MIIDDLKKVNNTAAKITIFSAYLRTPSIFPLARLPHVLFGLTPGPPPAHSSAQGRSFNTVPYYFISSIIAIIRSLLLLGQ